MRCDHCLRPIVPGALHYRFALALEGEQQALDSSSAAGGDELARVLAELEAGPDDPSIYDAQVHWETSGVLCTTCRAEVMTFFAPERSEPH